MSIPKYTVWGGIAVLTAVVLAARVMVTGQSRGELFFYCGAGMRPVVDEVVALFTDETGVPVRIDYNASGLLLGRLRVGRTGDLFMPGDIHYIETAAADGLIDESRSVASFVPVIMVAKGNPLTIRSVQDLVAPGVRLGLADARTAAVGRTARLILTKNDIPDEAVARNLTYESVTVHDLANAIELGHIDAAIVWAPVARRIDAADVVHIPSGQNVISPVALAVLSVSPRRERALEFVEFMLSDRSRAIFRQHGYGDP